MYPADRVLSLAGRPFRQLQYGLPRLSEPRPIPVVTEPAEEAAG
jgi:hypothetical protein